MDTNTNNLVPADVLTTIRITEKDGTVHLIESAYITGVWDGTLVVAKVETGEPRKSSIGFTVQNETRTEYFLALADVDRVEVGVFDDHHSETSEDLAASGSLTLGGVLDTTGEILAQELEAERQEYERGVMTGEIEPPAVREVWQHGDGQWFSTMMVEGAEPQEDGSYSMDADFADTLLKHGLAVFVTKPE